MPGTHLLVPDHDEDHQETPKIGVEHGLDTHSRRRDTTGVSGSLNSASHTAHLPVQDTSCRGTYPKQHAGKPHLQQLSCHEDEALLHCHRLGPALHTAGPPPPTQRRAHCPHGICLPDQAQRGLTHHHITSNEITRRDLLDRTDHANGQRGGSPGAPPPRGGRSA
jgi:hypothetical protein